MPDVSEPPEVPIPVLLRSARGAYAYAIDDRLVEAGFDDLPRNGPFVLGGMANLGEAAVDLIIGLGVSKQAASQLIDTLVVRGYLERSTNSDDRRRLTIVLTERGRAAGAAVRAGVQDTEELLMELVSPAELAGLRAGLRALAEIKQRGTSSR